jgi:hypothetical protein
MSVVEEKHKNSMYKLSEESLISEIEANKPTDVLAPEEPKKLEWKSLPAKNTSFLTLKK